MDCTTELQRFYPTTDTERRLTLEVNICLFLWIFVALFSCFKRGEWSVGGRCLYLLNRPSVFYYVNNKKRTGVTYLLT